MGLCFEDLAFQNKNMGVTNLFICGLEFVKRMFQKVNHKEGSHVLEEVTLSDRLEC